MSSYKFKCQYCGQEFISSRKDARTCSDTCRNMISRINKKNNRQAEEMPLHGYEKLISDLRKENQKQSAELTKLREIIATGTIIFLSKQQKAEIMEAKDMINSSNTYSIEEYMISAAALFPNMINKIISMMLNNVEKILKHNTLHG